MKFLRCLIVAAVSVMPAVVQAETDYIAMPKITSIQNGLDNADQIKTLKVHDNATIGGTLNVAGATTYSNAVTFRSSVTAPLESIGSLTVSTNIQYTKTTVTLTNGGSIALTGSWIELDNRGTASVTTTNPLPASYAASAVGRIVYLQASSLCTDSIHIAESAVNLFAATNLTLTADDSVILQIVATNKLRQISAVLAN